MRIWRAVLGFVLAAAPGFGAGAAVFALMNAVDWPIGIEAGPDEVVKWGIVGAVVGGVIGAGLFPELLEVSRSYKKPGTDIGIGIWGLLTLDSGIRGPVIFAAFYAAMIGSVVGGLCGEHFGGEDGAFPGAAFGVAFGALIGLAVAVLLWLVHRIVGHSGARANQRG